MADPEELARQEIDALLGPCGWTVQDKNAVNLSAARGIAVRELTFKTGEPDYTLFVDGKAIGTIEAKPVGHSLTGVEEQSEKYVRGVPFGLPAWRSPLPWDACRPISNVYRAAVLKAACEGKLVPTEAELARQEGRTYETGTQLLERIVSERRQKWNGKGKYKEPFPPNTTTYRPCRRDGRGRLLSSLQQLLRRAPLQTGKVSSIAIKASSLFVARTFGGEARFDRRCLFAAGV